MFTVCDQNLSPDWLLTNSLGTDTLGFTVGSGGGKGRTPRGVRSSVLNTDRLYIYSRLCLRNLLLTIQRDRRGSVYGHTLVTGMGPLTRMTQISSGARDQRIRSFVPVPRHP